MDALLGPVSSTAFVGQVAVVWFGGVAADWLAMAREEESSEESEDAARRSESLRVLDENLPLIGGLARQTVEQRRRAPLWVSRVGGMVRWLALMGALSTANMLGSLVSKPHNLFELVGLAPRVLDVPTVGLEIKRALDRGIDPQLGASPEMQDAVYKVLRDGNARLLYDIYGDPETRVRTLADIAMASRGALLYYLFWAWAFSLICSMRPRFGPAFTTGYMAIGLCLFLDASVALDMSSIRSNALLNSVPGFASMTTYERLAFLRHLFTPLLLLASLVYACHTFIDYEEHSEDNVLDLLANTVRCEVSMTNIAHQCQVLREEVLKGKASDLAALDATTAAQSPQAPVQQPVPVRRANNASAGPSADAAAAPAKAKTGNRKKGKKKSA